MTPEKKVTILIADDEEDILEFLSYNLRKEGFDVVTAQNGKKAIEVALQYRPELIILDVMMPEMDGVVACQELRQIQGFSKTLIIFLTARGEDYSQIAGFDAGADDYITKPIKPKVLISRIKALLRRAADSVDFEKNKRILTNSFTIDIDRHVVMKNDKEIQLPRKEFDILVLLASKKDRVFSRDEIFNHVWGDEIFVGERTIDVHIRKLREKIGDDHIKTIKGFGYKFVD
ncbi:MAG TPA: response regulator transcription factor [Salinivirgaceae bacterium]|nr:response regulator transcription factor [Salinivirgaceae bacterium]